MPALRNRRLLTLMLGHFMVDTYSGLLPVLYPLLIDRFTLSLETVGLVSLAYTGLASVSQPFFGWLADHYNTRYTGLALAWTAFWFATVGLAPSFPVLVGLAALAGLGSGAFHPLGALSAAAELPSRSRNTGMSIYVTGGTIGLALGPVVGAVLYSFFGVRGTALTVFPGLGVATWLVFQMQGRRVPAGVTPVTSRPSIPAPPIPYLALAVVIAVMMSRSWTVNVLQAFTPTWYRTLGYPAAFYGPLATTIVLASAFGMVGSGTLADRYGRRAVIVCSLVLTVPAIVLYAQFTGPIGFATGAALGFLSASTAPLTLLYAQQLMSGRAGLASGLVMGLGFVTGAIGVPITGAIADHVGLQHAMQLQVVPVLLTIGVASFLPSESYVESVVGRPLRGRTELAAPVSGSERPASG